MCAGLKEWVAITGLSTGVRLAATVTFAGMAWLGPQTLGVAAADSTGSTDGAASASTADRGSRHASRTPADTDSPAPVTRAASTRRSPAAAPEGTALTATRGDAALPAASTAANTAAAPRAATARSRSAAGSTPSLAAAASTRPVTARAAAIVSPAATAATVAAVGTLAAPTAAAAPVASAVTAGPAVQKIGAMLTELLGTAETWAAGLPTGPVKDFLSGALLLARRALDTVIGPRPTPPTALEDDGCYAGPGPDCLWNPSFYLFNLHFLNTTDDYIAINYSVDDAYLAGTPSDQNTGTIDNIAPGQRIDPRFDTLTPDYDDRNFTFTICSDDDGCASHADFTGLIDSYGNPCEGCEDQHITVFFLTSTSSFPDYPYVYTRRVQGDPDWSSQGPAVISIGIHDTPTARNRR